MIRNALALCLAGTLACAAQAARAADDDYGGDQVSAGGGEEDAGGGFELSYGAAITSEYIDDGVSQSNGRPALQGYVEGSYGVLYGGVWASTVDFEDDADNVEFDLYAGVRQTFGDLELSLSYVRYLYDDSGDCCGEVQLQAGYDWTEGFSTEGELDWDPQADTVWAELGVGYGFAPRWQAYSNVGTDFGTADEADEEEDAGSGRDTVAWEIGVSRELTENSRIEVFYHDSNENPDGVVATLSVDF